MRNTQAKRPSSEKKGATGGLIVDRLMAAYNASTIAGLAAAMDEPEATVKNWRYRPTVPIEHLLKAAWDTHTSLDWLVAGKSPGTAGGATSHIEKHAAVDFETDGLVLELKTCEPTPRSWVPAPKPRGKSTATGGLTRGARQQASSGALLPATGPGAVRPLVLSLGTREAGGTRLDYEVIPKVMNGQGAPRARQGEDDATVDVDRAGEIALTYEWLNRHLHHTTGELASVQVMGDGMAPTLIDGDTIIIDRGVREVQVDAIYVIHMLGQRLVKRVQRKLDGSLVIISDNQAYEREHVPRARVGEIEVVGRMVWPRVS
jgi:hypothetical protein